jgi:DGQHR domain-containing protein
LSHSFSVIRIIQNNKPVFVGSISGRELKETRFDVDAWFYGHGYQRIQARQKVNRISTFLKETKGILPTSILVAVRAKSADFVERAKGVGYGKLTVSDDAKFYVVDGQHRVSGLKEAMKTKPELELFSFPIVILCPSMWGRKFDPEIEEGKQFITINQTQTKVKPELVDSFLLQLSNSPSWSFPESLHGLPEDIKREMQLRVPALMATLDLNDMVAWNRKIRRPNESRGDSIIGQKVMVDTIAEILRGGNYKKLDSGPLAIRIDHYWQAILKRYPLAASNPRKYFLQKRLGLIVFNQIFPMIDAKTAQPRGVLNYQKVLRKKAKMPRQSFWGMRGQAKTFGTTYVNIDKLAKRIWPYR